MSEDTSNNQDDGTVSLPEVLTEEKQKALDALKKKTGGGFRSSEEALKLAKKEEVPAALMKQCLQTAIFQTSKSNPFMGSILQCMNITMTHTLPTAGVCFNPEIKRWDLLINPYFYCKKMNEEQRKAVLLHELYHITHKHPLRIPFMKLSVHKRRLMNIAMDMSINQYIKDIPDGCPNCPPPNIGGQCTSPELCCGRGIHIRDFFDTNEKTKKNIPWQERREAEFYYEKLLERFEDPDPQDKGEEGDDDADGDGAPGKGKGKPKKGQGKPKEGQGNAGGGAQTGDLPETTDVHAWDGSAEEKDMLEATEDLIKRAQIKCKFGYDELPGHIKDLLDHIKTRRKELNYKAIILQALKASLPANFRVKSWTRKSKRFGNKAPGNRNGEEPKLDNYIDTSGSISIEEANTFLDIIDEFLKVGARKCMLNMFHTQNYYRKEYKRGTRVKREDFQSGGTCLEQSLELVAKERPDLAIFLTDGYYSYVDVKKWVGHNGTMPTVFFLISKGGTVDHPMAKEKWARTLQIP